MGIAMRAFRLSARLQMSFSPPTAPKKTASSDRVGEGIGEDHDECTGKFAGIENDCDEASNDVTRQGDSSPSACVKRAFACIQ